VEREEIVSHLAKVMAEHAKDVHTNESLGRERMLAANMLDALEYLTGGPDHYVRIREDDWIVQHPMSERLEGTLFDCPVANVMLNVDAAIPFWVNMPEDDGVYRILISDNGAVLYERVDERP